MPQAKANSPEVRRAQANADATAAMIATGIDPREPDHSRQGMFAYHDCHRCDHGAKPCVNGGAHRCGYPHARND